MSAQQPMNVLVIGAAGFIGAAIVARLAAALGPQAVVAGTHRGAANFDAAGITTRRIDATDPHALDSACAGMTHLVNCVAGSASTIEASTHAAVEAARRHTLHLVHISSIAVYGAAEGDITEDTPMGRDLDGYGAAKAKAETLVQAAAQSGVLAVILRPALVHGPRSAAWTARVARLLRAGRLGDLGPAGTGLCNLVYIEDVAAAAVAALTEDGRNGWIFNLVAPSPPTWNAYLRDFGQALGLPAKRIPPYRLSLERRLAYPLRALEIAGSKVGRATPDPITPSLTRLFRQHVRFDGTRASALLPEGWTAYGEAIAASANWVRTEN